ncbi:NACHT domain-containing protein [Trichoderma simmonsii]|uniref:NACHT domain-containing protein n=1 Tax=Trichoderma simmonsii TaxID=1491479 RepID=A0A8G0PC51_9HYPO|nr:NACHT domain-containing protein [Trichoderma simmonsii]
MSNTILDTGLSVIYEAENSPPIVDIVFVHGLQGHPSKTWTYRPKNPEPLESTTPIGEKDKKRSIIRRMLWKPSKTSPMGGTRSTFTTLLEENIKRVFWPADLLPKECPNSRILTFGYDSKVTKYRAGAINHNSILSHSKDLLFSLRRERDANRPLIFIAHSLGGIVVKEMLARSSTSHEAELRSIVESTATIVFLGTPHRGSQDVAALGEVVRSVVSSLGMETTPVILDALGLKTTDLSRAQEDFSALWQKYDFQVKTFQEGLSLAKLGKKVVPDHSSLIGDSREHAETLQANHVEMCRYSGKDDPNYRKVAGELRSMYHSILRLRAVDVPARQRIRRNPRSIHVSSATFSKQAPHVFNCDQVNEACLRSLWFPAINTRYQSLEQPVDKTGSWLFNLELYQDWFNNEVRRKSHDLLWLKGKPGAGKSTLMKEAFRRAALGQADSNYRTAAFFFSAKGDVLEHSSLGLFQSLLYQLLPGDRENLWRFYKLWDEKNKHKKEGIGAETSIWTEPELKTFFESVLFSQTRTTIIFIDALDECDESSRRPIAHFWRAVTIFANIRGVLKVCLSSRHFPTITLNDCPEIIVEQHNDDDIATYVNHKFQICISTQKLEWELLIKNILSKADGVFLWAVLVVEDVLKSWDDGKGMPYLARLIADVPEELETLFSDTFSTLDSHEKELTVKFFQWAILATKPLRLHEWRHILAFIRQPLLKSLSEWHQSDNFIENDEQLEKQIRRISRGLVEVNRVYAGDSQEGIIEDVSIHAGAGSLDFEHGDTRIVQVIHESVREFFLKGDGFIVLDPGLRLNQIGNGHLSIMATCLDYLNIKELDALVQARIYATTHIANLRDGRTSSTTGSWVKSASSGDGILLEYLPQTQLNMSNDGQLIVNSLDDVNYANFHDSISDKKHRLLNERPRAKEEVISGSEMLKSLVFNPSAKIVEWFAKDDGVSAKWTSPGCSPWVSLSDLSRMSQQRILEDDPALLSYALFKLFTHALLADEQGADLRPFMERLKDGATWARWVALREDVPHGTKVSSYGLDMGLRAWKEEEEREREREIETERETERERLDRERLDRMKRVLKREEEREREMHRGGMERILRTEKTETEAEEEKAWPKEYGMRAAASGGYRFELDDYENNNHRRRRRRSSRARSVASFSSASSHDSYLGGFNISQIPVAAPPLPRGRLKTYAITREI